MTALLSHRGPDDEAYLAIDTSAAKLQPLLLRGPHSTPGKYDDDIQSLSRPANLFLGHRRLAILDLSSAGRQPLSRGPDLWISFNGEIYNYLELREELRSLGHQFRSQTDTEVILAAYQQWGEQCVQRFNGDWAFCIVDVAARRLFLSRDRYGIKPLFFSHSSGIFAFASEIKPLMSLNGSSPKICRDSARDYVLFSLVNHRRQTLFEGISQVLPGENMSLSLQDGSPSFYSYYRLEQNREIAKYDVQRANAYALQIRDILMDSVKLRLRADVPLGTCLSGGLDSSSVAAILTNLSRRDGTEIPQHSFTASFPGSWMDELSFANIAIKGSPVQSHVVYPHAQDARSALRDLLYYNEEPFTGPGLYTQWLVLKEAGKHVKVTLDGEGGDEVLVGYRNYRTASLADLLRHRRGINFLRELWGTLRHTKNELRSLPQVFFYALNPRTKFHILKRFSPPAATRMALPSSEIFTLEPSDSHLIHSLFSYDVCELLETYIEKSSLPHLLRFADRCSMSHSIESRLPFTDYRLVDLAFSIPAVFKVHAGWGKWLLRLAMQDIVPDDIRWRRDKLGYTTPSWYLKEDIWNEWLRVFFSEWESIGIRGAFTGLQPAVADSRIQGVGTA